MTEPAVDDGMLDALRQVPGAVSRTYLAPGVKVMFESINKNACTSLKWMMADLAGEDLDTFHAGWQPFVSETDAVHNRKLWKVSPKLDQLSAEERSQIGPDHGWFVFAVVRDPRVRLFSAWQNRLLMEIPIAQQYRDEWWYPRHPVTEESVLEDFAKFVDLLDRFPEHKVRAKDPHFRDQVELLAEHAVPYSRIYDISEMGRLRDDLTAHIAAQGYPGELHIPRANPTPLRAIGAAFEGGVREKIERIYAADFERFGDWWDFAKVEDAAPWRRADLDACESESELSLRISQLHELARGERRAAEEARARIAELEVQLAEVSPTDDGADDGLVARLTGRRRTRQAR